MQFNLKIVHLSRDLHFKALHFVERTHRRSRVQNSITCRGIKSYTKWYALFRFLCEFLFFPSKCRHWPSNGSWFRTLLMFIFIKIMVVRFVKFSSGGCKILYPPLENSTTRITRIKIVEHMVFNSWRNNATAFWSYTDFLE